MFTCQQYRDPKTSRASAHHCHPGRAGAWFQLVERQLPFEHSGLGLVVEGGSIEISVPVDVIGRGKGVVGKVGLALDQHCAVIGRRHPPAATLSGIGAPAQR